MQHVRVASRGASRLPNAIAIAIAVMALAVAAGAWFRPLPKPESPAAKTYSEQEVAEAKRAVCEAFTKGQNALTANSRRAGANASGDVAVVANSRIAIQASGAYLGSVLADRPPAPTELVNLSHQLVHQYEVMVLDQIGELTQSELDDEYRNADSLAGQIAQACR